MSLISWGNRSVLCLMVQTWFKFKQYGEVLKLISTWFKNCFAEILPFHCSQHTEVNYIFILLAFISKIDRGSGKPDRVL